MLNSVLLTLDDHDPCVIAAEAAEKQLYDLYGVSHTVRYVVLPRYGIKVRLTETGQGDPVVIVPPKPPGCKASSGTCMKRCWHTNQPSAMATWSNTPLLWDWIPTVSCAIYDGHVAVCLRRPESWSERQTPSDA